MIGVDYDPLLCELSNPPLWSIDPNGQQAGWRFIAKDNAGGSKLQTLEVLPVSHEVDDAGVVRWSLKPEPGNIRIFHRKPDEEHVRAMGGATNWLLRQMPLR